MLPSPPQETTISFAADVAGANGSGRVGVSSEIEGDEEEAVSLGEGGGGGGEADFLLKQQPSPPAMAFGGFHSPDSGAQVGAFIFSCFY